MKNYAPYYEIESSSDESITANVYLYQMAGRFNYRYIRYRFNKSDDKWHYADYINDLIKILIFIVLTVLVVIIKHKTTAIFSKYLFFVLIFTYIIFVLCRLLCIYSAYKTLLELIEKDTEV